METAETGTSKVPTRSAIACLTCASKKTRCDGQSPCSNCAKRNLECEYAKVTHDEGVEDETKNATSSTSPIELSELTGLVSALQKKVALLEQRQQTVDDDDFEDTDASTGSDADKAGEDEERKDDAGGSPLFAGPTSANYSLGMASILLDRETSMEGVNARLDPDLSNSASYWENDADNEAHGLSKNTITTTTQTYGLQLPDALRLIQVYRECVGVLHPIIDTEALVEQSKMLWPGQHNSPLHEPLPVTTARDIAHLKMVLAIALLAEGGGSSPIAAQIYGELQLAVATQMLAKGFSLKGQILLLLAAFYHVFLDDSRLASRCIAVSCRLMLESGLHQKQILLRRFPRSGDRIRALTILSTCLILDRQLNFNAGLPFTLKDADIDIPETDKLPAYLVAMRSYARIGPPAWAAITDDRGRLRSRIRDEDFRYLDYQVRCWQESLPKDLRPDSETATKSNEKESAANEVEDRPNQFLRYILLLRASQFKIVILRPLLFSAQSVKANMKRVKTLTEIAHEMIDTITIMNTNHDLYRKQQPLLNVFLSSALSTLVLVYVHCLRADPSDCISAAREGINKGLGLLQTYSYARSSQRLWKRMAGHSGLLTRLGFAQHLDDSMMTNHSISSDPSPGTSSLLESSYMPDDLSTYFWANLSTSGYNGFDDAAFQQYNENFQTNGIIPPQFIEMNPYTASGDANYMYGNMW